MRLHLLLALAALALCQALPSTRLSSGSRLRTGASAGLLPSWRSSASAAVLAAERGKMRVAEPVVPGMEPPRPLMRRGLASRVAVPVLAALGLGVLGLAQPSLAVGEGLTATLESIKAQANDSGFLQAFLLIFISEIGDKTFFIAGLLAAKYGRFISFTGSMGALAIMTLISTVLGQIFHAIPDSLTQGVPFDDIVAVLAFTYFGLKTLFDASKLEAGNNSGIEEEKAEAEEIVEELSQDEKRRSAIAKVLQTFTLVFAAEIGDRSFLSTIALSAALNPYAVATGAVAAHASATGIAVAGGVLLSKYLSEKVIGYIGGGLFLIFAVTTALGIF